MPSMGQMNDMFKQLQDVMNKCDSLSSEIKNIKIQHKKEIKQLKKEFKIKEDNLNMQISSLKKENTLLKEKNKLLQNEVDRLKSQINKDSDTSSKPPSSDIKPNKKDIPNNRDKSSKKVGGQLGHKGHNLSKSFVKANIDNGNFKHDVKHIGNVNNEYVSKYILDAKFVVTATEYRIHANEHGAFVVPKFLKSDVQYGNEIKSISSFLNVNCNLAFNKIADFINNSTNNTLSIATSSIVNFIKTFNNNSKDILKQIETAILNSQKMFSDNTTSRNNGKNMNVRNHSTETLTLFKVTSGKSKKHIDETGILPIYTGSLIHDHETVMYNYGKKHAECNVHVCRYLKGNTKDTNNSWSHKLRCFLLELNNYKKRLKESGYECVPINTFERISKRYDEILALGYKENKLTKNQYFKKEEKKLINRLVKYKSNHLMFLEDFIMPFDNNLSERDLRTIKIKQKVSGCFRSKEGQEAYCNILSIFSTCRKRNMNIFDTTRKIFKKIPVTI